MFFLAKNLLPNFKYQLINNYPPLAKNRLQKDTESLLPLLWHEFDNGLWTFLQSKVSCCLHMYFLWKHHLFCQNDQDSDSDWFIYCIDKCHCWHCFSVNNILTVSHVFEMTINFYYPTLELFCFSFTQPFTYLKFCLPNLFSLRCHPPP
jgi:hypothetical protein